MSALKNYNWISLTATRSTADIAWLYDIKLHGSTLLPAMHRILEHSTPLSCAMLGDPVGSEIETEYPATFTNITAYSRGYYLRDYIPYSLRQTKAGVDIPTWERAGSNYKGETSRTAEILSYENPSYHVMRMLWPLDSSGNPTLPWGYFNLYLGRVELVPNWGIGTGTPCKVTATLSATGTQLYVADLSVFVTPTANSQVKIFTYEDEDEDGVYDEGEAETDSEVCFYTAKSAASGAGCLTIVRTSDKVWNPAEAMAVYLQNGFDPRHPSIDKKQFFLDGLTRVGVLDKFADHCNMIYFTKLIYDLPSAEWREYFYWIPKFGVDETDENMLDLPDPITVTPTTIGLIGTPGPGATVGLEQTYNAVIVEACRVKDSAWFYGYACKSTVTKVYDTDGVTVIGFAPGTEIPRVLPFRTNTLLPEPAGSTYSTTVTTETNFGPGGVNFGTVAENAEANRLAGVKANQVLISANYQLPSYTASFRELDLDLYQSITFSGFEGFPEDEMRITEVVKNYNDPSSNGYSIAITCSKKTDLQASGKFQSIIDEIQANNEKLLDSASDTGDDQKIVAVIATYRDGSMATIQSKASGALIKTRSYGLRTVA